MTPQRRASARLGWVVCCATALFGILICVMLALSVPSWASIGVGLLAGMGLTTIEPTLYAWVTEPERKGSEDPLG